MADATGTTTYVYDGLGRVTSIASPQGTTAYQYDLDGNRTRLTYPSGVGVDQRYSAAGRLNAVIDWANRQSTYTYRPNGLVEGVTYPNAMHAAYSYDAGGRLTDVWNTVGAQTITRHTYTLDPEGNRTGLAEYVGGITASGATDALAYTYDGLNRLKTVTLNGAPSESFTFDGASNITSGTGPSGSYQYDAADRLQSDGTNSYGWSKADRVISRGQPQQPPPTTLVQFRAQSANSSAPAEFITLSRPVGTQAGDLMIAFVYMDNADYRATINSDGGWSRIGGVVQSGNHRGAAYYKIASASDPASWTWSYGSVFCIDDVCPFVASAEGVILSYTSVDPSTPLSPTSASTASGYSSAPSAASVTLAAANELVVASYGSTGSTTAASPSGWSERTNLPTSLAAGSMKVEEEQHSTTGASATATWNGSSAAYWIAFEVAIVPAPTPPARPPVGDTFHYDALDRLTSATVAGTTTNYMYAGDGLLATRNGESRVWDRAQDPAVLLQAGDMRIVHGLGPLYIVKSDGTTLTLARDGTTSVRAEVSDAGATTRSFRYAAYGRLAQAPNGAPWFLGFAGEFSDPNGLTYLRARWYDPASARFMTRDVARPLASFPATENAFAYAFGNPLRFVDRTGKAATPANDYGGDCDAQCIRQLVTAVRPELSASAQRAAPSEANGLNWGMADEFVASAFLVGYGVAATATGAALVAEGVVATTTGVGAVVGVPLVIGGAELVFVGVVSVGEGLIVFHDTIWVPINNSFQH